ncbi:hypothetical protein E2C01_046769 [Portunus trituberculatus]|uniref:Uncharacterized protein n=1 Tax=Portunus trituberculatus TaxID=210409 RepID=A0A5B7G5P7_PORTR|nr:hypothetical protein [Portunus trituberculatus]
MPCAATRLLSEARRKVGTLRPEEEGGVAKGGPSTLPFLFLKKSEVKHSTDNVAINAVLFNLLIMHEKTAAQEARGNTRAFLRLQFTKIYARQDLVVMKSSVERIPSPAVQRAVPKFLSNNESELLARCLEF